MSKELVTRDGTTLHIDPDLSSVIDSIVEYRLEERLSDEFFNALFRAVDRRISVSIEPILRGTVSKDQIASIVDQVNARFAAVRLERSGPLTLNLQQQVPMRKAVQRSAARMTSSALSMRSSCGHR